MQLEAAHAIEITKLAEYVDRKEDPLIQVVRTHQLCSVKDSQMPQDRSTRKMKESKAKKTKERRHGKRMHGQLPRKSWWILNSCIAG
jgi:hypothetical protein